MPQFDPALIEVMKKVLEDTMTRVPLEHSTPAAKAYFAEFILKAAAQGQTSYDALIVAAAKGTDRPQLEGAGIPSWGRPCSMSACRASMCPS